MFDGPVATANRPRHWSIHECATARLNRRRPDRGSRPRSSCWVFHRSSASADMSAAAIGGGPGRGVFLEQPPQSIGVTPRTLDPGFCPFQVAVGRAVGQHEQARGVRAVESIMASGSTTFLRDLLIFSDRHNRHRRAAVRFLIRSVPFWRLPLAASPRSRRPLRGMSRDKPCPGSATLRTAPSRPNNRTFSEPAKRNRE